MLNFENIKKNFPFFKNNNVIYFDNAATTQKPKQVIDVINNYYLNNCYNIGRGKYLPSFNLENKVKSIKKDIAKFINCKNYEEIFFTFGASNSSVLIANACKNLLDEHSEIMLCYNDHKSTILPWIQISKETRSNIVPILIDNEGDYKEFDIYNNVNNNTKIVVLTHIHNVYGLEMNIKKIVENIRKIKNDVIIVLDATQSIAHMKVDVQDLDIDCIYFSGHKMFAETGVGILYLNSLSNDKINTALFEMGTLNISGILSMGESLNFISNVGIDNIENYINNLTNYLVNELKKIDKVEFNKGPGVCKCSIGYGIVSFFVNEIDVSDVALLLADKKIYVRADNQCLYNNNEKSIRISFQIYNTYLEIDEFIKELKNIINE